MRRDLGSIQREPLQRWNQRFMDVVTEDVTLFGRGCRGQATWRPGIGCGAPWREWPKGKEDDQRQDKSLSLLGLKSLSSSHQSSLTSRQARPESSL